MTERLMELRKFHVNRADMFLASEEQMDQWVAALRDLAKDSRLFFVVNEEGWTFYWQQLDSTPERPR